MIQDQNNVITLDMGRVEPLNYHDGAIIAADVHEDVVTESAVQQALRELESVWMKHHHHYADVLDNLMAKVEAARGVI